MARFAQPMGLGGLRKAIEFDHRRTHGAGGNQLGDALERRAGAADRRAEPGHVGALWPWRLRAGSDEGGAAAGFQHRKGFVRHLTADGVEGGVAARHRRVKSVAL